MYKAIDLFAGSGGLTEGIKRAGFAVIGAVERDPLAAETYAQNNPATELWVNDIRRVDEEVLRRALGLNAGELDLLAGCPPCQGFSALRTLNGRRPIDDPRNDLIFDFQRFAEELTPRAIMMENVPRLADDRRLKQFASRLRKIGYTVDAKVLDVSRYGVPQRRRRLVLLAGLSGPINWAPEDGEPPTVRHAIGALPPVGKSGDLLHDLPEKRSAHVAALIRRIPQDGGSRSSLPQDEQLSCHRKQAGFFDVYGRMAWDEVAPTITTGCINPSKGRFLHPAADRAITLREAALLQGFPRDYWFSLRRGKYAVAELIGNALPPEFARRHALGISEFLGSQKTHLASAK